MTEQHYKNHTRYVPLFHFVTFGCITILLAGSIYKFFKNYEMGVGGLFTPALLVIAAIALLLTAWFARAFAIKAQDRAIRAEENLRYFAITGKLPDSKLKMSQIVALRFAPNNEFVDLAHRAVEENMSSAQIKQAIKQWKGDHHRV